jgi:glycosyltransferase involved in cell wall biosynthesis
MVANEDSRKNASSAPTAPEDLRSCPDVPADKTTVQAPPESLQTERVRRRQLQHRVHVLEEQLHAARAELELLERGVRYRLGDAIVRALRPSRHTLLLPFRLVTIACDGLDRVRQRRREAAQLKASAAHTSVSPARADNSGGPFPAASLPAPFTEVPREQVRRPALRIAGIMDEFSWRAWQYEADLYTFTPASWQRTLEARPPHLLFVESTWSGVEDAWRPQLRYLGQQAATVRYAVPEIVRWCRQRQIPTVFYNKEDPPNFDVFIDAARQFDFVFTSDANCIEDYRRQLAHDRVFALPFAAQPRIHNPVWPGADRTESVCFAGTWYTHRHFNRQEEADRILRPGLAHGLHIYDRMAWSENELYRWPAEYQPALRGSLSYAQMLVAYKRYKLFLNINSVASSPTMFSRRVFELLACGTPVISAYSLGIETLLGADVVTLSEDEAYTRACLERLLSDDELRERRSLVGQRRVLGAHTYTDRMTAVLGAIGLDADVPHQPSFAVAALVDQAIDIGRVVENFTRQAYPHRILLLCARHAHLSSELAQTAAQLGDRAQVILEDGAPWSRVLERALAQCTTDYVAAMHPCDYYGAAYLTDYAHAALYVHAPALGKTTHFAASDAGPEVIRDAGREYRVAEEVCPTTLCVDRAWLRNHLDSAQGDVDAGAWWAAVTRALPEVYSTDRFNYVNGAAPSAGIAGAAAWPSATV